MIACYAGGLVCIFVKEVSAPSLKGKAEQRSKLIPGVRSIHVSLTDLELHPPKVKGPPISYFLFIHHVRLISTRSSVYEGSRAERRTGKERFRYKRAEKGCKLPLYPLHGD
jgi:hypothetical protein